MTNFYSGVYNLQSLVNALNATGPGAYACGPCISSLTAGTNISITPTAQQSGVGWGATISFTPALRIGTAASIPADGSVATVSFSPAFASGVTTVNLTPMFYSGSDNAFIACRIVTDSASGFSTTCGGGQSGTTVSLSYFASGT